MKLTAELIEAVGFTIDDGSYPIWRYENWASLEYELNEWKFYVFGMPVSSPIENLADLVDVLVNESHEIA